MKSALTVWNLLSDDFLPEILKERKKKKNISEVYVDFRFYDDFIPYIKLLLKSNLQLI